MVYVLVSHKVDDYNRWKAVFDDSLMTLRNAGGTKYRIFRNHDDVKEVTILCQFETLERARNFFSSEQAQKSAAAAGVVGQPEIRYLQEATVVRRTAAD